MRLLQRHPVWSCILSLLVAVFVVGFYNVYKPLPEGISFHGKVYPLENIQFLKDITYVDKEGIRHSEQEIFDEVFNIIKNAKQFILIDMFLYNGFQGSNPERKRLISRELTVLLIAQKRKHPAMQIVVITDPINTVYGGLTSEHLQQLKKAGISITITKLERLRDSNPLYSSFWRIFFQPFGNGKGGMLPNPFGKGRVSLRSYLKLINFKANHRKVLIADSDDEFVGLVTSANPHDGSSAHGNIAVKFSGAAVKDLFETEKAVLSFSGGPQLNSIVLLNEQNKNPYITIQIVTENNIKQAIMQDIQHTKKGDHIDLVMFYLSDREIIKALKEAHQRGVTIRILLDPNKDAFGRAKNGIPNRQVARELYKQGIQIRWCDTHGEQCHAKMMLITYMENNSTLILGSANFTRRNLNNLNLETDVVIKGSTEAEIFEDSQQYFDIMWGNTPGQRFSVSYKRYADNSIFKTVAYRLMEATGMCTF